MAHTLQTAARPRPGLRVGEDGDTAARRAARLDHVRDVALRAFPGKLLPGKADPGQQEPPGPADLSTMSLHQERINCNFQSVYHLSGSDTLFMQEASVSFMVFMITTLKPPKVKTQRAPTAWFVSCSPGSLRDSHSTRAPQSQS